MKLSMKTHWTVKVILDRPVCFHGVFYVLFHVLVGTGSRTMKIIKIKSLKVYAFGFYVHPYDVCAKLGPKYASILAGEVNKCHDFYKDLLRYLNNCFMIISSMLGREV
ncbi:hypothetical protein RHMOL_Rhmol06G0143200 [Rhododendron molle]|uniref:Uncharacterized protein n=1 Tax=Rhododendron molle TaxID=49168 RepID=A0ACC0NEH8_RHOML|nr:hypothetical protein RHMOL_Rhmol06G0143200 [Rhododendron molle]